MTVKILLVDDHPVLRLTLRKWLERARDLKVVGEAEPGTPVLGLIALTEPDVVLVDVHASPEEGLNMARLIQEHYPELPMVAIGDAKNGKLRAASARAGAWGYFPNQRPDEMARAIRSVIGRTGKQFVDLSKEVTQRPAAESFVGLPDARPEPAPPQASEPKPQKQKSTRPAAESFVGLPDAESELPAPAASNPAPSQPRAPQPAGSQSNRKRAAPRPAAPKPAAPKLAKPKPSRPAAESFVGLPDEEALRAIEAERTHERPEEHGHDRTKPEPKPARKKAAVPATAPPPKKPALNGARADTAASFTAPAAAPAPVTQRFDLGPSASPRQKTPRTRRKKKEVLEEAIEVRGPTGLPRRFGGHR